MAIEVVIYPFEKIADHLLNAIRAAIEERFSLQATIGEELAAPARAYSRERGQYLSSPFLDILAERTRGVNQIPLGVTVLDLYAPKLNFVFGESSSADRVALFPSSTLLDDGRGKR
jgi:predicted Zn-dependent protease